jgi:hypothetical protein
MTTTDRPAINKAARLLGWTSYIEQERWPGNRPGWYKDGEWVAHTWWSPYKSHDDAQLLIEEIHKRRLWPAFRLVLVPGRRGFQQIGCMNESALLLLTPAQKTTAAVEAIEAEHQ